jgi:5-methylcytosine-specific restriction endonuclease McrA
VKASSSARGLGWDHQKRRALLLRRHVEGSPCGVCLQPMFRSQDLDADHTVPRSQGGVRADRLLHSSCNRSRGDGSRGDGVWAPLRTNVDW